MMSEQVASRASVVALSKSCPGDAAALAPEASALRERPVNTPFMPDHGGEEDDAEVSTCLCTRSSYARTERAVLDSSLQVALASLSREHSESTAPALGSTMGNLGNYDDEAVSVFAQLDVRHRAQYHFSSLSPPVPPRHPCRPDDCLFIRHTTTAAANEAGAASQALSTADYESGGGAAPGLAADVGTGDDRGAALDADIANEILRARPEDQARMAQQMRQSKLHGAGAVAAQPRHQPALNDSEDEGDAEIEEELRMEMDMGEVLHGALPLAASVAEVARPQTASAREVEVELERELTRMMAHSDDSAEELEEDEEGRLVKRGPAAGGEGGEAQVLILGGAVDGGSPSHDDGGVDAYDSQGQWVVGNFQNTAAAVAVAGGGHPPEQQQQQQPAHADSAGTVGDEGGATAHHGGSPRKRRGEPNGCLNDAPCPPCTSHGASIRRPFGAGKYRPSQEEHYEAQVRLVCGLLSRCRRWPRGAA
jgi:hypothetical protein